MTTKAYLHHLIDEIADCDLVVVESVLEALCDDPSLDGTLDTSPETPETPEEAAAVAEAYEDIKAGRVISHEDVKREFSVR